MNSLKPLWWSLGTVVVAALVSAMVAQSIVGEAHVHPEPGKPQSSFHDWLHANLKISEEQEEQLRPFEDAFHEQVEIQRVKIWEAGHELANAIRHHDANSQEVTSAQERLLAEQGKLQRMTLDHFFAMKDKLTPDQGELLLKWTHDSIIHGYEH